MSQSIDEFRESKLNGILLAYIEACEAGNLPDRREIISANPELKEDLKFFFEERDRLERFGGAIRSQEFGGESHNENDRSIESKTVSSLPGAVDGQLGDFRLVREIGRGGMGVVYEAEQISLGRRVAIKVLPFASALDPRHLQRFRNEASAAAHLQHENIVSVHAVGCERGVHYFAMQYVEGQSLASLLTQLRQSPVPSPMDSTVPMAKISTERQTKSLTNFDWIAGIGRQAALALEHAHLTGVIHRDIKPGNLLLDTRRQLWITDFGLAQIADNGGLTMTGELLGTLRYASPEQTLGRRGIVDHRSDIYSLGATLYELLTLRPPFEGNDRHELLRQITECDPPALRSIDPTIPENLETIVLKSLRKDPADRYPTAQEFADDLQRFLERKPIVARPPSAAEIFWSCSRRHPAIMMSGAVALLLMTLGSVVIAVLVGAEQERTREEQRRTSAALHSERLRAEQAESRFGLARRAVDELISISEEELAYRPETVILRKRILRSALAFYQEFLIERDDDPQAQTELLETTKRVGRLLADLEVLRSSMHFYLLFQPEVQEDLLLSKDQLPKVKQLTSDVVEEWKQSFKDFGVATPSERARRILKQAKVNDEKLNMLLTMDQQDRLRQIGLQAEGAAAFRDQEVSDAIGLSLQQLERIRVIEEDASVSWMRKKRGVDRNDSHAKSGPELTNDSKTITDQRILELLTDDQIRKWRELTGEPLKKTIHPDAK